MRCESEEGAESDGVDFRRVSAKLIAAMTAVVGAARLDLAEDAAQDALLRALKTWSLRGTPDDPEAWLVVTARRALIDRLRREKGGAAKAEEAARRFGVSAAPAADASLLRSDARPGDDALRLLFLCCRPELPRAARVALALKECCGFGVSEISAALRSAASAVAQTLVRAKRRLRELDLAFEMPAARELPARLDDVREAVYALFNEGWRATAGSALVREDLVVEALRLVRALAAEPGLNDPATRALRALLCLHAARLPARTGADGAAIALAEQDRSRWDRALIAEGFAALAASLEGSVLSRFHIEASIASLHAMAPSFKETDWEQILDRYDALASSAPSDVVTLNRVVAVAMARGAAEGRAALAAADLSAASRGDATLPALNAFLAERDGDQDAAASAWLEAAAVATNGAERAHFLRRAESAARRA